MSALVGRVAKASALAQVFGELVTFAQTIALARLLTPTDIGIFTAGTVLTGLFTTFVEGGLRAGLVQRQGDLADADETVFWVTLMVGAAASLGCLAAAPVIGIIFNSRAAGLVAAATAGVLLIHSLTNVPESVLQREFSVKRRLIVGPATSVGYAVVAVGLAALGWGVWSMVAGTYAFYITWVVSLWMITSWRPGRGHASVAMWRELARFGFPLVLAVTGWRLRTAVEAVVVGRVLSAGALGFFRYGQRIAQIPLVGIVEVGATTLFPAFSRIAGDRERLAAAYLRALHWPMVGAAACTGLMIAAGEPAVVVLFGERWRGAGVALVAMSGMIIASPVIVVVQDVIKARGRTRLINWFALADLFLGVGFLLVLIGPFGFVGASLYVSLTSLTNAAVLLALAQLVVSVPFRRVLTVLATPMPSLLVATTATWWLEHDVLRADSRGPILAVVLLAVDALVFCLVYLAVLTVFARPTVVTIVRIVPVLIARFRGRALADTTTTTTKLSTRVAEAGATSPEHRKTKAPAQSPSAAPASPSPAQQQQAHVGDQFTVALENGTKYQMTLLRVDQQASPANEFEAAEPGHHLAAAQFRVTATASVDENANNNATATGSDEQAYTPSLASVAEGTNFANGQIRLQPGGSLIGWVTFELPDGVRITMVQWTPASGFSAQAAEWLVNGSISPQQGLPPTQQAPSRLTSPPSTTANTPKPGNLAASTQDLRTPASSADSPPPQPIP